ncbi:MAG: FAD-binding oxidoreductase [Candidatus Helarchaeota archaeon]
MNHEAILRLLKKAVGSSFVTDRQVECYYYAQDSSAEPASAPEYIVMPKTVEEIQKVLRIANREKIPVTPRVGGLTLSGLAIPYGGGILLDLKRMDKIWRVNAESMYAVVECGVTIGQLKTFLETNYPNLWFNIPHAPPGVGVISNALIYGSGHLSLQYGLSSDMINGIEVVLPTGDLLKSGSCALGESWLTKSCLPDFTGLFHGWFGSTGIVTKAAIQLWPKPKLRDAIFYSLENIDYIGMILTKLTKLNLCDDICGYSWTGSSGRKRFQLSKRPENIPELTLDLIISGNSSDEINLKRTIIKNIFSELSKEEIAVEEYTRPLHLKENVLMVPRPYPFMDLLKGGGTEYLGCYIPLEETGEAYKIGKKMAKRFGFQYLHFIRALRKGHLLVILYIFPFVKQDHTQRQSVLNVIREITAHVITLGGIPWKASPTVQKVIQKFLDPIYIEIMKKIRNLLDPNRIMAQGQWNI